MSLILGIGYDLWFKFIYLFMKKLRKHTQFDLGFGCAKDGNPHYDSIDSSRTPSRT